MSLDINDLTENPEKHGFKFVSCDKCGGAYYADNFAPTECFGCMPCRPPEQSRDADAECDGGM